MKKMLVAVLCLFGVTHAFSQNAKSSISLDDIVSRLQTLSTTKAAEKVYLHLDRTQYNAGDTIYFKAYLTLGEQHQLSKLSGVLHVDLLNQADSLVKNIMLQTTNGLAWGDFELPANVPKGTYHIRAYTKWMFNNTDPNIFDEPITVNSPISQSIVLAGKQNQATDKFNIQFFAEGGTFVDDIPAKLAFRAVNEHGLGAEVKGVVVDNMNTEVTKFEAKHLGMGIINIIPVEGRTYKAKLTYADGTKATVDLPLADVKGMTLLVNSDNPDKLLIEINANRAYYLENKNKEIGVVIYSNGSVRSVKTVLDSQVIDLGLAKKDFQTGVVQVTLFSNTGEPMNERLSFIQNNDLVNLQIGSDKQAYAARDKVHISLKANKGDKPVNGYFSVSVIDASKITADNSPSILTDLLLSSQLKEVVEQPGYYFTNVSNDTRANLDILMLTQRFSRFQWKQLLGNYDAAAMNFPVEKGIDLSGMLETKGGTPVQNGTVTLLAQGGSTVLTQVTDAKGKFTFANLSYADNTRFMIEAKTGDGKSDVEILMDEPKRAVISANRSTQPSSMDRQTKTANQTQPIYLADASGKMLKEVIVNDKKFIAQDYNVTQVANNNQVKNERSLSAGLRGKLNGVSLNNGVPYLTERLNSVGTGGAMMIILDDVALTDGASVDDYNINEVESVKVLKNTDAAFYGVRGANGVLLIKTLKNKAAPANKVMAPGLLSYTAKGFYKAHTFYSPVYGGSVAHTNNPDLRSTIYWNPDVVTDKDGNSSFDYFNADRKGAYRVVIEGIDENGNLGRGVYTYKVE